MHVKFIDRKVNVIYILMYIVSFSWRYRQTLISVEQSKNITSKYIT